MKKIIFTKEADETRRTKLGPVFPDPETGKTLNPDPRIGTGKLRNYGPKTQAIPKAQPDPSLTSVPKNLNLPRKSDAVFVPPAPSTIDEPQANKEDILNLSDEPVPKFEKPNLDHIPSLNSNGSFSLNPNEWTTINKMLSTEEALEILSNYKDTSPQQVLDETESLIADAANKAQIKRIFSEMGFEDFSNLTIFYFVPENTEWNKLQKTAKNIRSIKKMPDFVPNERYNQVEAEYNELNIEYKKLKSVVTELSALYDKLVKTDVRFRSKLAEPKQDTRIDPELSDFEKKVSSILGGRTLEDIGILKTVLTPETFNKMNEITSHIHGSMWKQLERVISKLKDPNTAAIFAECAKMLIAPEEAGLKELPLKFFDSQSIESSALWQNQVEPHFKKLTKESLKIPKIEGLFSFIIGHFGNDLNGISQFFSGDIENIISTLKDSNWVKVDLFQNIKKYDPQIQLLSDEIIDSEQIYKELSNSAVKYKILNAEPSNIEGTPEWYRQQAQKNNPEFDVLEIQSINAKIQTEKDLNARTLLDSTLNNLKKDFLKKYEFIIEQIFDENFRGRDNLVRLEAKSELGFGLLKAVDNWDKNSGTSFYNFAGNKLKGIVRTVLSRNSISGTNIPVVLKTNEQIKNAFETLLKLVDLERVSKFYSLEMVPKKKQKISATDAEIGTDSVFKQRLLQSMSDVDEYQFRPVNVTSVQPVLKGTGFLKDPELFADYALNLFNAFESNKDDVDQLFLTLSKVLDLVNLGESEVENPLTSDIGNESAMKSLISFLNSGEGVYENELYPQFSKRLSSTPEKWKSKGPTRGPVRDTKRIPIIREFVYALFNGDLPVARRALAKTSYKFEELIPQLAAMIVEQLRPSIEWALNLTKEKSKPSDTRISQERAKIINKLDSLPAKLILAAKRKREGEFGAEEEFSKIRKQEDELIRQLQDVNVGNLPTGKAPLRRNLAKQLVANYYKLNPETLKSLQIKTNSVPRLVDNIMNSIVSTFLGAATLVRPTVKTPNANRMSYSSNETSLSGLVNVEDEDIKAIRKQIELAQTPQETMGSVEGFENENLEKMLRPFSNSFKFFKKKVAPELKRASETSQDIKQVVSMTIIDTIMNYLHDIQSGNSVYSDNVLFTLFQKIDNNIKKAFKSFTSHLTYGNSNFTNGLMASLTAKLRRLLLSKNIPISSDGKEMVKAIRSNKDIENAVDEMLTHELTGILRKHIILVADNEDIERTRQTLKNKLNTEKIKLGSLNPKHPRYKRERAEIQKNIMTIESDMKNKIFMIPEQQRQILKKEIDTFFHLLPTWLETEETMKSATRKVKGDMIDDSISSGIAVNEEQALNVVDALQEFIVKQTFNPIVSDTGFLLKKIQKVKQQIAAEKKEKTYEVPNNKPIESFSNPEIRELESELKTLRFAYQSAIRNAESNNTPLSSQLKNQYQTRINDLSKRLMDKQHELGLNVPKVNKVVSTRLVELQKELSALVQAFNSKQDRIEDLEPLNKAIASMKNRVSDVLLGSMLNVNAMKTEFKRLIPTLDSEISREIFSLKFFEFYYILTKILGTALRSYSETDDEIKLANIIKDLHFRNILKVYVNPRTFARDILTSTPYDIIKRFGLYVDLEDIENYIQFIHSGLSMNPVQDQAKKRLQSATEELKTARTKKRRKYLEDVIEKSKAILSKGKVKAQEDDDSIEDGGIAFDAQGATASSGNRVVNMQDSFLDAEKYKMWGFKMPLAFAKEVLASQLEGQPRKKWWVPEREKVKKSNDRVSISDIEGDIEDYEEKKEELREKDLTSDNSLLSLNKLPNIIKMMNKLIKDKGEDPELFIYKTEEVLSALSKNILVRDAHNFKEIEQLINDVVSNEDTKRSQSRLVETFKGKLKQIIAKLVDAKLVKLKGKETDIDKLQKEMESTTDPKKIRLLKQRIARLKAERAGKEAFEKPKSAQNSDRGELFKKPAPKPGKKVTESLMMEPDNSLTNPFQRIINMIEGGKMPQGSLKVTSLYLKKFKPEKFRQLQSLKNSCEHAIRRGNDSDGVYKFGQYNVYMNNAYEQYIIEKPDSDLDGESINFFIPKSTLHIQ